jgi:hypothetical protein
MSLIAIITQIKMPFLWHCLQLLYVHALGGFPVQKYKEDRWGLIAAYWGFGLQIGRALITQNDYNKEKGVIEGSILNHVCMMSLGWQ